MIVQQLELRGYNTLGKAFKHFFSTRASSMKSPFAISWVIMTISMDSIGYKIIVIIIRTRKLIVLLVLVQYSVRVGCDESYIEIPTPEIVTN